MSKNKERVWIVVVLIVVLAFIVLFFVNKEERDCERWETLHNSEDVLDETYVFSDSQIELCAGYDIDLTQPEEE